MREIEYGAFGVSGGPVPLTQMLNDLYDRGWGILTVTENKEGYTVVAYRFKR